MLPGEEAGGARRWIIIAGFNFQPSEFAKIAFILFFASLLSDLKKKDKIDRFTWGFCYPFVWLIPIVISILILQNHFSATFLICAVTCIQFNPMDDDYFISGSLDAKVRIWSIPDRQLVDYADLHEMVTAASYSPDGQVALLILLPISPL